MKNILKKGTMFLVGLGTSVLAFAQDSSAADTAFTTFMTGLKTDITNKIVEMLPILGGIATAAFVIFIAVFAVRKAKTFLNRGA